MTPCTKPDMRWRWFVSMYVEHNDPVVQADNELCLQLTLLEAAMAIRCLQIAA